MNWIEIDAIIQNALAEDIGPGDLTTELTIEPGHASTARLIAKADGVIAGLPVFARVFALLDPAVSIEMKVSDGDAVAAGDVLATLSGPTCAILSGERVALNLLQRMSGIATLTRRCVEAMGNTHTRLADTRKTMPGLRLLEKYAVRMGGGTNHRYNLADCVLIKDNHIRAADGISPAVKRARAGIGHTVKIEVEVENLDQLKEALCAGADIIMLDNMNPATMKKAVSIVNGKAVTEASGNIDLSNIKETAAAGVDVISMGGLTHSAPALDISLKFE
jgi:nicotinate-nucleotide pyrophosphorylase (carboxylating)